MGMSPEPPLYAQLASPVTFKPQLTYFVPARLEATTDGRLLAHALPGNGSGDFTNLTATDAFLELPANQTEFPAGTSARAWSIG
jgi:molybdopterin molybdotransferase